jgi:hypothetical protein
MLAVSFMSPLFPGKRSEEEEGRERRARRKIHNGFGGRRKRFQVVRGGRGQI